MKKYYVYEYIRLDTNEPFYVGKGSGHRWKTLKRENRGFTDIVNNKDIVVNILHENLKEDIAYDLECWYIHEYIFKYGYSLVNSKNNLGGENPPYLPREQRVKINKGRKLSIETKQKMSESQKKRFEKKENHPMYRKYGENHHNSKKVMAISIQGGAIEEYGSITDASRQTGLSREGIRDCCAGRLKTYKNYIWILKEDFSKLSFNMNKLIKERNNKKQNGKKVTLLNNGLTFNSLKDASIHIGLSSHNHISSCCRGKRKSAGKINGKPAKWMYYEDYLELQENKIA